MTHQQSIFAVWEVNTPWGTIRLDAKQVGMSLIMMAAALLLMLGPDLAMAQSATLPWETGTCKFAKAFVGPWVGWVAVIAIALAGIAFGVGESNAPMQTAMRIAAGFSIAVGAVAVVGWFWPNLIVQSAC